MAIEISIEEIKHHVQGWVTKVGRDYFSVLNVEIVKNEERLFWAIFHLNGCMAQVIVAEPQFAPYRNVSFEVVSTVCGETQSVFNWFDCDEDDTKGIIRNLQLGIEFAINYTASNGDMLC